MTDKPELPGGVCWAADYIEAAEYAMDPYKDFRVGDCKGLPSFFVVELHGILVWFPACGRHKAEFKKRRAELEEKSRIPFVDHALKNICTAMRCLLEMGVRPGIACHYGSNEVEVVIDKDGFFWNGKRFDKDGVWTQCRRHLRILSRHSRRRIGDKAGR